MSDHKISILSEKFENENTGELVEGIKIMIDGKLKSMLKNTTNLNETVILIFYLHKPFHSSHIRN